MSTFIEQQNANKSQTKTQNEEKKENRFSNVSPENDTATTSTFIEEQNAGRKQTQTQDADLFVVVVDKDEIERKGGRFSKGAQIVKVFLVFIVFAVSVPLLTVLLFQHEKVLFPHVCSIESGYRVRCGLVSNATDDECVKLSCCFDEVNLECFHYIPSRYNYDSQGRAGQAMSPLGSRSHQRLQLSVEEVNTRRLKITLHRPEETFNTSKLKNPTYTVTKNGEYLGVEVFRNQTGERLITTLRGPVIASEHYWEWTFQISNKILFGLGQVFIAPNSTLSRVIYKSKSDHNTLPSFITYLNGSFHGVSVDHDGPLEVTVLPSKLVVLKSLAGNRITLDLHVGPGIRDVVRDWSLAGFKAPPYWALGVHLCRYK